MSFTTMSMFAPHIWGSERDAEMRAARAAGWRRADLIWERLLEAANRDWLANDRGRARRHFRQADFVARLFFAATDPRRATAQAGLAILARHYGQLGRAERFQRRALLHWQNAAGNIAAMEIRPRTRSSLFHLRLEVLHRDRFHDNLRRRIQGFTTETGDTLRNLTSGGPAPHRHFARWRGERPAVFDDTRKMLAACLLIPDS